MRPLLRSLMGVDDLVVAVLVLVLVLAAAAGIVGYP